jgi:hypothetical protein
MRAILSLLFLAALSACAPPGGGAPTVSFGPTTTVTVAGKDFAVRAA